MLGEFKRLLAHQYEAAFCTLNWCIDQCADTAWDAPVVNLTFCQVAFHTLFYADYYLGQNEEAVKQQDFHRDNEAAFRDYEELQDRKQQLLYERSFIEQYMQHCRDKATTVLAAEDEESLLARCEFPGRDFSRGELHVYNIRHIQHHAAQLGLRQRIDFDANLPWIRSGWREA